MSYWAPFSLWRHRRCSRAVILSLVSHGARSRSICASSVCRPSSHSSSNRGAVSGRSRPVVALSGLAASTASRAPAGSTLSLSPRCRGSSLVARRSELPQFRLQPHRCPPVAKPRSGSPSPAPKPKHCRLSSPSSSSSAHSMLRISCWVVCSCCCVAWSACCACASCACSESMTPSLETMA